jgi:hypothetical protein
VLDERRRAAAAERPVLDVLGASAVDTASGADVGVWFDAAPDAQGST